MAADCEAYSVEVCVAVSSFWFVTVPGGVSWCAATSLVSFLEGPVFFVLRPLVWAVSACVGLLFSIDFFISGGVPPSGNAVVAFI